MNLDEALNLVRRLTREDLPHRDRALQSKLRSILIGGVARNRAYPIGGPSDITDELRCEYRERAAMVWDHIHQVVARARINLAPDAAVALSAFFAEFMDGEFASFTSVIAHYCTEAETRTQTMVLRSEREELESYWGAQFTLWIAEERAGDDPARHATFAARGEHSVFNISQANIGSVQTGPGAVARVEQGFTASEITSILDSLRRVEDQIRTALDVSDAERSQALSTVEDMRASAADTSQGLGRLTRALTALSVSIQTGGALQPCYETLKSLGQTILAHLHHTPLT